MTLDEFNQLPHLRQLLTVLTEGTLLATRWESGQPVKLFYLPSSIFFEIYYNTKSNDIMRLRTHSFINSAPLEKYLEDIKLPRI